MLEQVAGGWAFRASREAAEACARLFERPVERGLSQAALETLAIVAYLGPCTRPEIARMRGVAADSAVAGLVERGLIAEAGREPRVGARPLPRRRRSSSVCSGSRACRSCRGSTSSAATPKRSARGFTPSRNAELLELTGKTAIVTGGAWGSAGRPRLRSRPAARVCSRPTSTKNGKGSTSSSRWARAP